MKRFGRDLDIPTKSGSHIPSLDGLRGIAAVIVVWHHIGLDVPVSLPAEHGYLAVPFFFILSGFVIAKSYEERMRNGMRAHEFAMVRATRLLPMIWIAAIFALLAGATWRSALLTIVVVPGVWHQGFLFFADPPEWSLAYELGGNALHFALARWLTDQRLVLSLQAFAPILVMAIYCHGSVSVGSSSDTIGTTILLFVICYLTGVLLFRADRQALFLGIRNNFYVLIVAFALTLLIPNKSDSGWNVIRDIISCLTIFPIIIVLALSTSVTKAQAAFCNWLGNVSFPLYIIHSPILRILENEKRLKALSIDNNLCGLVYLITSVGISWAAFVCIDRPVRALLRKQQERLRRPTLINLSSPDS